MMSCGLTMGKKATNEDPVEFAKKAECLGAGEVVINSIDHDGVMGGYNLDLARQVRKAVNIPMTVLGGAGSLKDISRLIDELGIVEPQPAVYLCLRGNIGRY